MAEEGKAGNSGGGESNDSQGITIKVGDEEKVFKAEDVENLLAQQAAVTQRSQEIAAISDAAKKYGLDPSDYVAHAEGSFAVMTKLREEGLIDEEMNIVEKKSEDAPKKETPKGTPAQSSKAIELDAVTRALKEIDQRVKGMEEDQTRMMRMSLHKEIQGKHPELSDDDVSRIFGTAMNDRSKNIWQHAEDSVVRKKEAGAEARKKFAEEFNIDLEKWDANKIKEQSAEGGGAASILGKKKLSFKAKPGDPNAVTPKKAMEEYFAKLRTEG